MRGGVSGLGSAYRSAQWESPYHAITYTVSGAGEVRTSSVTETFSGDKVLIVPAGKTFEYSPIQGPWRVVWFQLFDHENWQSLRGRPIILRPALFREEIAQAVTGCLAESTLAEVGSARLGCLHAEAILAYLQREIGTTGFSAEASAQERLQDLWAHVGANLSQPWNVDSLAHWMALSPRQFHRVAQAANGTNPMKKVTDLRMAKAEQLLAHGGDTVQAVAEKVGYYDVSSFSRAFKRHAGLRPQAYRERSRKP